VCCEVWNGDIILKLDDIKFKRHVGLYGQGFLL